MKKRIFSIITICLIVMSLTLSAFAHSGRTDSSGGHKDNKNKSGLGPYHYHCGGYPPHLHSNGVCPYKGGGSSKSSSSSSSTPKTIYATSITATKVPSKINIGETMTLEASVYPSNAEDKTISWESSDTSVLTVSSTGSLTAIGLGTAIITAKTSRGTSKQFKITVEEVMAESIDITINDKEILIGSSQALKCEFIPENTMDKTVVWSSSDESIISVSANGEITANKLGTATITAMHKELSSSIEIEVKPIEAESISITKNSREVLIEDTRILECEFVPENTTDKTVVWSSSDESIISISADGKIKANKIGVATITATHKELTDSIEIEVKPIDAKSIKIVLPNGTKTNDDGNPRVMAGSKTTLKTEILPENTTYKDVIWSVSDKSIATIDEKGVLTADKTGNVIVTAKTKNGVTTKMKIEIYSYIEETIAGVVGVLLLGGGGAYWYFRRKKKESDVE